MFWERDWVNHGVKSKRTWRLVVVVYSYYLVVTIHLQELEDIPFSAFSESTTPLSIKFFNFSILAWSSGSINWIVRFFSLSGTNEGRSRMSIWRLTLHEHCCNVQQKRKNLTQAPRQGRRLTHLRWSEWPQIPASNYQILITLTILFSPGSHVWISWHYEKRFKESTPEWVKASSNQTPLSPVDASPSHSRKFWWLYSTSMNLVVIPCLCY